MKETKEIELWYNYRTQAHDRLAETPQDFKDYIPQSDAEQNMYSLLVHKTGYRPINAAIKVLEAGSGER
jgi:hypothetical protein